MQFSILLNIILQNRLTNLPSELNLESLYYCARKSCKSFAEVSSHSYQFSASLQAGYLHPSNL